MKEFIGNYLNEVVNCQKIDQDETYEVSKNNKNKGK